MHSRTFRKHLATIQVVLLLMLSLLLSGCGAPKISVTESGKDYALSDTVQVEAAYDLYNIQAPVEDVASGLATDGIQNVTIKSHNVVAATSETNDGGKYDAVDSVVATVEGDDFHGTLPQTIDVTIEFKRLKGTDTWEQTNKVCSEWDIDDKKIGGTVWKKEDGDKTYYLRISNSMEFLFEDIVATEKSADIVKFFTTLPSVYAVVENGEVSVLIRALILSGTVTSDGVVTLTEFQEKEVPEIVLSDYEMIDKSELPFTEEEYKKVIDAR